jgi:hypothetical protein
MKKTRAKAGSRAATKPPAGSPEAPPSRDVVSPQEIERRAYDLYLRRGRTEGSALQDWLQAEGELLHK